MLSFLVSLFAYSSVAQQKQKQLFFEDPRAGSFTLFSDIPVSHTTGVPDITIPLYTMESHGYKIPIALKYHLAMVKPPYDYTNVATGWVLDVGGTITQEVKAIDDLKSIPPPEFRLGVPAYATSKADRDYLDNVQNKWYDFEHDFFNFSFGDKAGAFIVDKNATTPGKFDIRALTSSRFVGNVNTTVLSTSNTGNEYNFDNITMTDDHGNNYYFHDYELGRMGGEYSRSYFLNEIRTSNNAPLYTYEYASFAPTGVYMSMQNMVVQDDQFIILNLLQTCSGINPVNSPQYQISGGTSGISYDGGKTVKKVTFENGTIDFALSSNNKFIEGLTLKDKNGNVIKQITFETGNFPGQGYRYLSKVNIKDKALNTVESYSLNYNGNTVAVSNNSLALDYWGYLVSNAESQPFGYMRMGPVTFEAYNSARNLITVTQPGDSRFPSIAMTELYTLKSIQYPTGGRSEFSYGLNQYSQNNQSMPAGGMRIEKITNYTEDNRIAWQRRYEYMPGEIDFFYDQNYAPSNYNYFVVRSPGCGYYIYKNHTQYFAYAKTPPVTDNRVRYKNVTEYFENGTGTSDIGKIEYEYVYYTPNLYDHNQNNWYVWAQQDHISNGNLRRKTVYKKTATGYDRVSEEINDYLVGETFRIPNLFLNRWNYYVGAYGCGWATFDELGAEWFDIPGFQCIYYNTIGGTNQLAHKKTTQFTDHGDIVTEQGYEYSAGQEKCLIAETLVTSDGTTKKTSYKYAFAPEYAGQAPYNQMVANNIIGEPVEIKTSAIRNGVEKPLTTVKFNFSKYGANIYRAQSVQEAQGTDPLETRFVYDYDTYWGNLSNTKKNDDLQTSYIYDASNSYPVAQVTNAPLEKVAYTSFEDDYGGGWIFQSQRALQVFAPTGKYGFDLGLMGPVSAWTTPGDYIVSYWSKSGQQNVNGTMAKTGRTILGWTYYEHKITVSTTAWLNVAGNGIIDELRLYPAGARMNTFAYDPLIGMTSKCDVNNRITYFKYDVYSRLQQIKDQDGNVVKVFCYNFAGQPEDCSINSNAAWTPTGNTRCQVQNSVNTGYQEREEVDQNSNSATYTQTRWVVTGYNVAACPTPAQFCTISYNSGFTDAASSVGNNGTTVFLTMEFSPNSSSMVPGTTYLVATVSGTCRPSQNRVFSYTTDDGRSWSISVLTDGTVRWYLNQDSPALPQFYGIYASLSYAL